MTTQELPNMKRIAAYWALMPTPPPEPWQEAVEKCVENIIVCCDLLVKNHDLEAVEESLPVDIDDDFDWSHYHPGPNDEVNLWRRSEHFLRAIEIGIGGLPFPLPEMEGELNVLNELHFRCAESDRPEHPLDQTMIVMGYEDSVMAARNRAQ